MRLNQLRARLRRLESPIREAAKEKQAAALQETRRLDQERLCALLRKRNAPNDYGGRLTDAETQKLETLQQRPRVAINKRANINGRPDLRKIFAEIDRLKEQEDVYRRFRNLELKVLNGECAPAEQEEVELLRATYGISPADNPLFKRYKRSKWEIEKQLSQEGRGLPADR